MKFILALFTLLSFYVCMGQSFQAQMFPSTSPDGSQFAFLMNRKDDPKRILKLYVCKSDGSSLRLLIPGDHACFRATWFPDAKKILFSMQSGKYYQLATIQSDGTGLSILTNNTSYHNNSAAVSPDGKFVAYETNRHGKENIYIMNLATKEEIRISYSDSADKAPAWSPDGKKIVFHSKRTGNNEIFIMNVDGTNVQQLTHHPASDADPQWSHDGKRISFASNRDGQNEIYFLDVDNLQLYNFSRHPKLDYWGTWLPKDERILFHSARNSETGFKIFTAKVDGSDLRQVLADDAVDH